MEQAEDGVGETPVGRSSWKQVPVDYSNLPEVQSRYATDVVVQTTGNEYILLFFEIRPPLIIGHPPDNVAIPAARAECVGRIIVSKDRMAAFGDTLVQAAQGSPQSTQQE